MEGQNDLINKTVKNYHILGELGSGAFSVVYKGQHVVTHEYYAIKVFPKTNLEDSSDADLFQREVNAMAFMRHEALVALYDFFWDDSNFYLVMDFCPGGELFDYIVDHDKIDEPTAAFIFKQIASAVQYSHSFGVAHRDLKPENVLITKFPFVKITDFGLCGYISEQRLMKTFCGSPCYCAPECLCRIQYDGRLSDIWSMGVLLYAMVTGEHPWNISNTSIMLRQILKGAYTVPSFVSSSCKNLITKMLNTKPKSRITIDQVMQHPWLKKAKSDVQLPPSVPPIMDTTLERLAAEVAKNSDASECGILSPFSQQKEESDLLSSLPKLCVRSASVENFRKVQRESLNTKGNGKPLIPLAGHRQNSVAAVQNRANVSIPRTRMQTIVE